METPKQAARQWIAKALSAKTPQPHDHVDPRIMAMALESHIEQHGIAVETLIEWIEQKTNRPTVDQIVTETKILKGSK